ncbi:hypothetical protein [Tenacibaculum insulae]|uniref:hypothetical protein n=1 Tax=Tenacibaculum insulae TaxID=2029677 RepID=UPI003AB1B747
MKITTINKKGDWSFPWNDTLIKAAKENKNNNNVGEQLLLETDQVKVWSIHLPAGATLPFHQHSKPYFYTAKCKGKSRSYYTNGSVIETTYQKDDIKYFNDLSNKNYFVHNLENIGTTTLIFTTVEFKN